MTRSLRQRLAMRLGGSLRSRLVASAALFVIVAIPLTGLAIAHVMERVVRAEVAGRLDLQLSLLRSAFLEDGPLPKPLGPRGSERRPKPDERGEAGDRRDRERDGDGPPPPSLDRMGPDRPPFDRPGTGWYWRVLVDGREVAVSRSLATLDLTPAEPDEERGPPGRLRAARASDGEALLLRSAEFERAGDGVRIEVTAPRAALSAPLRDAFLMVSATLGLLGLLLIGAILVQVRFGLSPLERLRVSLAAVREGRSERIGGAQPAELKPLVDELNALIEQDAAHLRQARLHVANLAHGLKTPLATLVAATERVSSPVERAEMQGLMELMDRRIRHHLRRARTAALGGARHQADVARHAGDLAAMLEKFREREDIRIETRLPPGVIVGVDGEDLDEMLGNLLDNALAHARGRVVIDATGDGREVLIRIADDGPGLSPTEIATVRQPGRRLDESQPGHGFGLPITAEIAELYGGRLELGRALEGGLEARLVLPAGPGAANDRAKSP
ncbi:sensor histidine kinase [Aureimonas ureilytica]|uniref:sensor histidine kinase n=1 Tax=Aureimonas ureilytica TaxID=401562 RepID=UPI003CF0476A